MSNHEFLISRIGKRVTAFLPMTHGNAMLAGILSQTATGWEIGDDPMNSMTFKEDMIESHQGNVLFIHYHKI
jgi:hypothetical protein